MIRLSCALVVALTLASACGSSDEEVEPTVSKEVIEELWLDTPGTFALIGGVMQLADDEFRLGVIDVDGDVAELQILHRDRPELDRVVSVRQRSVFTTLTYEVMVGTVDDEGVVVSWRTPEGS